MAAFHNSRPVSSEKSEENSASPVDSPRSLALKPCAACGLPMKRSGYTEAGSQRWKCGTCRTTATTEPRHNPAWTLAADLARLVRMTRTGPNLQAIQQAIESEAEDSGVTIQQAAALIAMAATQMTRGPQYSCSSSWEVREIVRENTVDRFWFEDARWRSKGAYTLALSRLQDQGEASA